MESEFDLDIEFLRDFVSGSIFQFLTTDTDSSATPSLFPLVVTQRRSDIITCDCEIAMSAEISP